MNQQDRKAGRQPMPERPPGMTRQEQRRLHREVAKEMRGDWRQANEIAEFHRQRVRASILASQAEKK
jgi:hypothetical protein